MEYFVPGTKLDLELVQHLRPRQSVDDDDRR